jgi:hypothetical protein
MCNKELKEEGATHCSDACLFKSIEKSKSVISNERDFSQSDEIDSWHVENA